MRHLTMDLYLLALRGGISLKALARRAHSHLLELCSVCRGEWDESRRPLPLPSSDQPGPVPGKDVPAVWLLTLDEVVQRKHRLSSRKAANARARQDLRRLDGLPLEAWPGRVAAARTRFRSRACAEHLVEESRCRVRSHPREAAVLAEAVPQVLSWARRRPELSWVWPLLVRAEAHRANALRVAGDLPEAAKAFQALRRQLQDRPVADPRLSAEVDSLEASLAGDLRDFAEAERLLEETVATYRGLGAREGEARSRIKLASLLRNIGRPLEGYDHFVHAAELLDPEEQRDLYVCTVTGRVNTMCDLDRAEQAQHVLDSHEGLFLSSGEDYLVALHQTLVGRVRLGLADPGAAERCFATARDHFLEMGRDYDAILGSLFLADALLASGKTTEVRTLAADLVQLFHSRGVARETLASLRLLAQAAAADRLTASLLQEVRRKLEGHSAAIPGTWSSPE